MKKFPNRKTVGTIGWVLLYGWALVSVATSVGMGLSSRGGNDFKYNWENAFYLLKGYNIYDPSIIQQFGLFPHFPPSCFFLLFPLVVFPETWAKVFWLLLNLTFTVLLVRDLLDLFWDRKRFWPALALVVCCSPYQTLIHLGQYTLFSLYFFVLALKLNHQGRTLLSGTALVFAFFKFTLIVPMLLYLWFYQRSWKSTAIAVGFHVFFHEMISLYLGKPFLYLLAAPFEFSTKTADRVTDGYLDFFAFWFRLTGHTGWVPWVLVIITLLILAFLLARRPAGDGLGLLALTAMVSSVLMYHRSYDCLIIILPIFWFWKEWRWDRAGLAFLPGILFVGYASFHYFYLIPGGEKMILFMNGDTYLNFLSLLWYSSVAAFFFYMIRHNQETQGNPILRV